MPVQISDCAFFDELVILGNCEINLLIANEQLKAYDMVIRRNLK